MAKTCETCGYYHQRGECGNYFGPRGQAKISPEDSCKEYATLVEVDIRSVCHASVDCAKARVAELGVESIKVCLERETRSTVRKMLEARLRKLEKK